MARSSLIGSRSAAILWFETRRFAMLHIMRIAMIDLVPRRPPISGLSEIGAQDRASRQQPTCVAASRRMRFVHSDVQPTKKSPGKRAGRRSWEGYSWCKDGRGAALNRRGAD